MNFINAYITIFFVLFLIFPTVFMCTKLFSLCCFVKRQRRVSVNILAHNVRQTPVYTIASDPRNDDTTSNFTDFFWDVSRQNNRSNEPAKDDKDLPSYEDVIRMEMDRQVIVSTREPTITAPTNTIIETVPPVRLPV